MMHDDEVEALVRSRVRSLRLARRWTLDDLARRCWTSASTISRLETGRQRMNLAQLASIARALGTSTDALVEPADDGDVVIRPHHDAERGVTTWLLGDDRGPGGMTVAKVRLTAPPPPRSVGPLAVHPGRDWFTVLSGTVSLLLGERTLTVETGQAASFSTMVPHAFGAAGGAAEILTVLDREGDRSHLDP